MGSIIVQRGFMQERKLLEDVGVFKVNLMKMRRSPRAPVRELFSTRPRVSLRRYAHTKEGEESSRRSMGAGGRKSEEEKVEE